MIKRGNKWMIQGAYTPCMSFCYLLGNVKHVWKQGEWGHAACPSFGCAHLMKDAPTIRLLPSTSLLISPSDVHVRKSQCIIFIQLAPFEQDETKKKQRNCWMHDLPKAPEPEWNEGIPASWVQEMFICDPNT